MSMCVFVCVGGGGRGGDVGVPLTCDCVCACFWGGGRSRSAYELKDDPLLLEPCEVDCMHYRGLVR